MRKNFYPLSGIPCCSTLSIDIVNGNFKQSQNLVENNTIQDGVQKIQEMAQDFRDS